MKQDLLRVPMVLDHPHEGTLVFLPNVCSELQPHTKHNYGFLCISCWYGYTATDEQYPADVENDS